MSETILPEDNLFPQYSMGDPVALEMLIRSYYAQLCRFAEKFLPDAALAEDVVQESFIKLWKSGLSFTAPEALQSWLYTTTRNGCLDLVRSRHRMNNRHQQVAVEEDAATDPILADIIRAEYIGLIYQIVDGMSDKMQQVFFLSYREGMTVSEIAVHLGMDLKAVKKQKYKALVAIRSRLAQHGQPLLSVITTAMVIQGKPL